MDVKSVYYVVSAFAPKLISAAFHSSCFQSFSHRTASPNTDERMGVMFKSDDVTEKSTDPRHDGEIAALTINENVADPRDRNSTQCGL